MYVQVFTTPEHARDQELQRGSADTCTSTMSEYVITQWSVPERAHDMLVCNCFVAAALSILANTEHADREKTDVQQS